VRLGLDGALLGDKLRRDLGVEKVHVGVEVGVLVEDGRNVALVVVGAHVDAAVVTSERLKQIEVVGLLVPVEELQQEGPERELFAGLIREVVALGRAMGIEFEKDLVETGLQIMDVLKPGSTTSMQRDILRGGKSEFAGLVTRVVELGEKYQVPVPLYRKVNEWGKEYLQLHG
jgi:hypothetical protein